MDIIGIIINIGNIFENILFYEFFGFPLLVLLLIFLGIFFSFYLKFPFFKISKQNVSNFLKEKNDNGLISLKQAFFTSLSYVVGMGGITGVATAVCIGGPGTIFWMFLMVIFTTNVAIAETLLAVKYKEFNSEKKTVVSAPINYIKNSLKDDGFIKLGVFLSTFYGILYFFGSIGNQIYQIGDVVNSLKQFKTLTNISFFLAIIFDVILLSIAYFGITKISKIFEKTIPIVCSLYLLSSIIIVIFNIKRLPFAILTIIKEAFKLKSVTGGIIGAISMGVRRGIYSCESGLGTYTTPYAATKSNNPIKEAQLGSLNPLVASSICLITGIIVVLTGSYVDNIDANGINIMIKTFSSVSSWFSYIFTIITILMSFSLCLSNTFNTQNVYQYFFGTKSTFIFMIIHIMIIALAMLNDFSEIVTVSDTLYLSMALPNMITLFMSRKKIRHDYEENINKL